MVLDHAFFQGAFHSALCQHNNAHQDISLISGLITTEWRACIYQCMFFEMDGRPKLVCIFGSAARRLSDYSWIQRIPVCFRHEQFHLCRLLRSGLVSRLRQRYPSVVCPREDEIWALDAPFKGRSLDYLDDASIKAHFSFSNNQIRYWSLSKKKVRYWCQCNIRCSNYEHALLTALGTLQKMVFGNTQFQIFKGQLFRILFFWKSQKLKQIGPKNNLHSGCHKSFHIKSFLFIINSYTILIIPVIKAQLAPF
jgi:hypothetical protein